MLYVYCNSKAADRSPTFGRFAVAVEKDEHVAGRYVGSLDSCANEAFSFRRAKQLHFVKLSHIVVQRLGKKIYDFQ